MRQPNWPEYFRSRRDAILEDLRGLVIHESPSREIAPLDAARADLVNRLERVGTHVEIVPNPQGADHVLARIPGESACLPALILGHYDTVWPLGTLERMPFRIADGRAAGPGVYDMKAGLAIVLAVFEAYRTLERKPPRPVWFLITSDEEVGSLGSRPVIEDCARQSAYALVVEPALANGGLKTARKGVGRFHLEIVGKAAHAGVEPGQGHSAVVELAHQILALRALEDRAAGATLTVGMAAGGSAVNVVPAHAWADVDARAATTGDARRLEHALKSLIPVDPAVQIQVTGGFNRPPMERTPAIAALFEQARVLARTIGQELNEGSTGGGSDGNFTAALGIPTLDGLGAIGGGAHAESEHVVLDSLPARAALLAVLLEGLKP